MCVQTRLTALDLIGYAAGDERPRQFVHMPEQELDQELISIKVRHMSPWDNGTGSMAILTEV